MSKHKFDPAKFAKLDSSERRQMLPAESVVTQLDLQPGQKVADLGCGIGYFSFPIAEQLGAQGTVYALDISPEMLVEASKRYDQLESNNLASIHFLQSQEVGLPLADASVDLVFMANVLHELDEPRGLLQEAQRVLKDNGRIAVVDWQKAEMPMGPPIAHRLSEEEAKVILQQADFKEAQASVAGSGHYLLVASTSK